MCILQWILIIYIYIYICRRSKERKKYFKWVRPRRNLYFLSALFIYLFCSYIRMCFQLVAFVREHIWHMALLMGHSMRFELTRVCSLNGFRMVMGKCKGHSSFFFWMCLPYPILHLIGFWYLICFCRCVYIYIYILYIYIYIYIYI